MSTFVFVSAGVLTVALCVILGYTSGQFLVARATAARRQRRARLVFERLMARAPDTPQR